MRHALVVAYVVFLSAVGLALLIVRMTPPEPPTAAIGPPELVRVLDVTIRDSNTTNRRQRFECRPMKESK